MQTSAAVIASKNPPQAKIPSRRFRIHGVPVELAGGWDALEPHLGSWIEPFAIPMDEADLPGTHGSLPVTGTLKKYDQREVMRHLSPKAVRLSTAGQALAGAMELYQEDERFWLVDDRWGMVELNLLKGAWRTWLLPKPTLDPVRCAELALLWPMAQVLRSRGLTLMPAVSVAKDDVGVMILSPMGVEAELAALIAGGYRVLGQRWSCLREKGAAVDLLHLPGVCERARVPSLSGEGDWVDLEGEFPGSSQASARCQTIVIIEPMHRSATSARELPPTEALDTLRRAWPIAELHRARRQLARKLAAGCRCVSVQLSRRPEDLLTALNAIERSADDVAATDRRDNWLSGSRRFVPATVQVA